MSRRAAHAWVSLFVFILLCGSKLGGAVCDLQYLKEPVTSLSCNPYNEDSILRLQCDIQLVPSITNNDINILWFFSNGVGDPTAITASTFTPFLRLNQNPISQSGTLSSVLSIDGSLLNSPAHVGTYYCQPSLGQNLYRRSIMLMVESSASYQSLQSCGSIQVQNSSRCAGNFPLTDINSAISTQRPGFNIGEIEEDLHIGIYVFIFVLVVALGLSTVIIMVFLARRCDKQKLNSTSEQPASSQPRLEATLASGMEMQNLDSSVKTKSSTITKMDDTETAKLSTFPNDKSSRESLDTYTSMKPQEDKYIDPTQAKKSVLLSPLPPKPLQKKPSVIENVNVKPSEDLYEELPEKSLNMGVKGKEGGPVNPKSNVNISIPDKSSNYATVDGNQSNMPKLPDKDKKDSNKPPRPLPLLSIASDTSMTLKTTTDTESLLPALPARNPGKPFQPVPQEKVTEELALYDDMTGADGILSPPQKDDNGPLIENNYDVIPAESGVIRNNAYGALGGSGGDVDPNPDNIYEALDQEEALYTAMS